MPKWGGSNLDENAGSKLRGNQHKDKFGLSWQVVPKGEMKLWRDHKSPATKRAFAAMMDMTKLDIAKLKAAYKGK